jgi:hypothetical protein
LRRNVEEVRARIGAACARAGRAAEDVVLVAVTKSAPVELIPRLLEAGVKDVAENRPIEGGKRIGSLAGVRRHLIGHLQTNKAAKALTWADVIHSVDRPALVEELSRRSPGLPVFLQVNVSGEASKGGFRPEELPGALRAARATLRVEGLMTMAPIEGDPRPHFRALRELAASQGLKGLSMGMSGDFEAAVEEGATHVRVGSRLFEGVAL